MLLYMHLIMELVEVYTVSCWLVRVGGPFLNLCLVGIRSVNKIIRHGIPNASALAYYLCS